MDRWALAAVVSLGAALSGCGGDVETEPGGGGGGAGATGSTTGSTTGPGGTTASAGSGGDGPGGGGGGAPACEDFVVPPDLVDPVTVRLVNGTATDLFVGDPTETCAETHYFTLSADGAPEEELDPYLDHCEASCEMVIDGACGCSAECIQPVLVKIAPGGEHALAWPGLVYDAASLPPACVGEGCEGTPTCSLPRAAPTALARSTAATALDCTDDGLCDCEVGPTGSCELGDGTSVVGTSGETRTAAATFVAGSTELVLTFR